MHEQSFSDQLEKWLTDKKPKTFQRVSEVFGPKSFATLFVLLMVTPALPLPTGGVTHVFEIITILLALGYMSGRDTIWIPKRWENKNLGHLVEDRVLPRALKIIRPIERFSQPRFSRALESRAGRFGVGLLIIVFTLAAFLAPPFSGLDTLPALGVVIISLGLLFSDALIVAFGTFIGTAGIALVVLLGEAIFRSIHLL
jgi:hypothetical protein